MFDQILLPTRRGLTRKTRMQLSELMTIVVFFHISKFRTFKDFYVSQSVFLQRYFPSLLSYTRFVSLIPRTVFPLFCYLFSLLEQPTGISFIDSTILTVCHRDIIKSCV